MAFAFDISADPRPVHTSTSPRLNATLVHVVPAEPLRVLGTADLFTDEIDIRLTRVIEGRKAATRPAPAPKPAIRRDPRDLSELAAA